MLFFYDLGSPYAWLTAERIRGATWVPVLLGGIFRATGRSSWAETENRAAGIAEIERRARERGLPHPTWPEPWPNNGLTAMRAAAHVDSERFALEAFRVHFVDGLALSDPENVALAATRAGLDADEVLAATDDPAVKERLKANTERALAAGVIGVPSVELDGGVVWGDDLIDERAPGGEAGRAEGRERVIPKVVLAPMAGGISTPELAIAVSEAGGLGYLAAGYREADGVREEIRAVRAATDRPFGVNLLSVVEHPVDQEALRRYAKEVRPDAERLGVELGAPTFSDDDRAAKLELLVEERVPFVSFAFACPSRDEVAALQAAGSQVWVTVTEPYEVPIAEAAGADALVVQGVEAGGHRGTFDDADGTGETGLLALLRLVAAETRLPLVAAGGIMDRHGVQAALAAGAVAVQAGTAFMLCPEAATTPYHRAAFATAERTALTRAFTGRRARGLVNRFMTDHPDAPAGYPQVASIVNPIRAAARANRDPDAVNLWAGQAFRLARAVPAQQVVSDLAR